MGLTINHRLDTQENRRIYMYLHIYNHTYTHIQLVGIVPLRLCYAGYVYMYLHMYMSCMCTGKAYNNMRKTARPSD